MKTRSIEETSTRKMSVLQLPIVLILMLGSLFSYAEDSSNNKNKIAVSLSYDDALNSQLDNALSALNRYDFKASFYVLSNSPVMAKRLDEWREAAAQGHELGNHSMFHPCRASLPNRDWVPKHHDLDGYSVEQMVEEVKTANVFLNAIDGQTERTYTAPCGDQLAGGNNYISEVKKLFVAIKGQGLNSGRSVLWAPADVSGQDLIDYIQNTPSETKLINILFHGIGGDYLAVSTEAHEELLRFLSKNKKKYYVDSYINIMKTRKEGSEE